MAEYWISSGITSITLDLEALKRTGLELQEKDPIQTSAEPQAGYDHGFQVVRAKKAARSLYVSPTNAGVELKNTQKGAVPHQGRINLKVLGIPIGVTAADFQLGYDPERSAGGYYIAANVTILGRTVLFDLSPVTLSFDPSTLVLSLSPFKLLLAEELGSILELRVGRSVTGTPVGTGISILGSEAL